MLKLCSIKTKEGLQLYGTLHKANTLKKSLVVISHGYFSSNRIGPHRLYYQIAERIKNYGYNVIRFDLRGMGESDGSIENVKYQDHVSDLEAIILSYRQKFNDAPIILISHCIGCNISLPIIEKYPTYFDKVIFISPYFTTKSTINTFFDKSQQIELYKKGFTYRKGIYADLSFFQGENEFLKFTNSTRKYNGLINVISAAEDQFIPLSDVKSFYNAIQQTPMLIEKADHNYLDGNSRKNLILKILEIIQEK